jgi:hypothetical protein
MPADICGPCCKGVHNCTNSSDISLPTYTATCKADSSSCSGSTQGNNPCSGADMKCGAMGVCYKTGHCNNCYVCLCQDGRSVTGKPCPENGDVGTESPQSSLTPPPPPCGVDHEQQFLGVYLGCDADTTDYHVIQSAFIVVVCLLICALATVFKRKRSQAMREKKEAAERLRPRHATTGQGKSTTEPYVPEPGFEEFDYNPELEGRGQFYEDGLLDTSHGSEKGLKSMATEFLSIFSKAKGGGGAGAPTSMHEGLLQAAAPSTTMLELDDMSQYKYR